MQYCSFKIGEYLFGIDVLLVREINNNIEITPVDQAPENIRGLLNLRGQIVTVLDVGISLGLEKRNIHPLSRIIILKSNSELEKYRAEGFEIEDTFNDIVGLLVDQIDDMVHIEDDQLEITPANLAELDMKKLKGVVKLDHQIMTILKINQL